MDLVEQGGRKDSGDGMSDGTDKPAGTGSPSQGLVDDLMPARYVEGRYGHVVGESPDASLVRLLSKCVARKS